MPVEVQRNGETKSLSGDAAQGQRHGSHRRQIAGTQLRNVQPAFVEALKLSADRNWEWTRLIVKTLIGLFTRETSVKQLMGPVAIAAFGRRRRTGVDPALRPHGDDQPEPRAAEPHAGPVLDGGHILILALEGLSRRDFSIKVKEKMLIAGFVLLVTLMVTVIYNDLTRIQWIERLMPWR